MYRIYIVEDERTIAEHMKKQLEKWGYTVKCSECFNDIIREFTEFDPHIVLMDVMLPFLTDTIGAWKSDAYRKFR